MKSLTDMVEHEGGLQCGDLLGGEDQGKPQRQRPRCRARNAAHSVALALVWPTAAILLAEDDEKERERNQKAAIVRPADGVRFAALALPA